MKLRSAQFASYEEKSHRIGRVTLLTGLALSFMPSLILWLVYGIIPPVQNLLNGMISISVVMLPVSLVEVLTFSPMLGTNAMYMSYLSGNIANMKIPSAAIALEVAEVEPSTEEGDIIATLAIGGSVLVSEIILLAGVLLIIPLSGQFQSPWIEPACSQILPALFGSIGAYSILKEWKLAVAPLLTATLLALVGDLPTALTIPICVLTTVLAARFFYNRGLLTA